LATRNQVGCCQYLAHAIILAVALLGSVGAQAIPTSTGDCSDAVGPTTTCTILDIGDMGSLKDGTIVEANPLPTSPSTGTGVFEPFLRTQITQNVQIHGATNRSLGYEFGYNTDTGQPALNFDAKPGPWTHSITLGDVGTVRRGGDLFLGFSLDADEPGSATSVANQIDITDIQIFLGTGLVTPEALGSYTGTPFDSSDNFLTYGNLAPVWSLDSAENGDATIILQASICEAPGQCGSGKGDMDLLVPAEPFLGHSLDENLVFYVEYMRAGGNSGGFEEWRASTGPPVPEPSAALTFTVGLLIAGAASRRARRTQA
jgi:hypothetical protein